MLTSKQYIHIVIRVEYRQHSGIEAISKHRILVVHRTKNERAISNYHIDLICYTSHFIRLLSEYVFLMFENHIALFVNLILGELGYVNIGVGYTLPFPMIAAEWIKAEELSKALTDLNLPGLRFRPIHVKPFYSVGKGVNLQGVQIYITDKDAANLSLVQFYVMQEMARLYPEHKTFDHANQKRYNMFDKVSGSNFIREEFSKRHRVEDIIEYWNKDVDAFKRLSSKYYIY